MLKNDPDLLPPEELNAAEKKIWEDIVGNYDVQVKHRQYLITLVKAIHLNRVSSKAIEDNLKLASKEKDVVAKTKILTMNKFLDGPLGKSSLAVTSMMDRLGMSEKKSVEEPAKGKKSGEEDLY